MERFLGDSAKTESRFVDSVSARRTEFSPDRKYRYTLWRQLKFELPFEAEPQDKKLIVNTMGKGPGWYCQFIGLNPSTADETNDDPTIRRCMDYCLRWGFREFCMTNLFAYRATDPRVMKAQSEPVGPDNVEWIVECAKKAGLVVAAWGCDGKLNDQDEIVLMALAEAGIKVHALKLTKDRHPSHPLYLSSKLTPIEFAVAR